MNTDYCEVPKRLLAYRKSLAENQEEMAKRFGIGQDHYSRLESGSNIISYKSMKTFEENGGDIYFLITGKKRISGICDTYFARIQTPEGRKEFVKIMLWIAKQGILLLHQDRQEELDRVWKYLRLAEQAETSNSIWKDIREIEKLSQVNMAARLDINVKRYQRMENMGTKPDAEILHTLFGKFGYSPLILLEHKKFPLDELNEIWMGFPDEIKKQFTGILEVCVRIIEECERGQR